MSTEREAHFRRGARFFKDEKTGLDMFEHRLDSASVIGPRPASKVDKENHEKLWADYLRGTTEQMNAELTEKPRRKRG